MADAKLTALDVENQIGSGVAGADLTVTIVAS